MLHSPTDPTSIVSHHLLNYQTSEENRRWIDDIDRSNYRLFSTQYTITKLQSSGIDDKKLWLKSVHLVHKEYVEPDSDIIRQAISMRNQMQAFLITDGPLLPAPPRDRPIATQDNRISDKEQQTASIWSFRTRLPPVKQSRVSPTETHTDNLQQQTLTNSW